MPDDKSDIDREINALKEQLLKARPNEKPMLFTKMGEKYHRSGRIPKSIACYKEALDAGLEDLAAIGKITRLFLTSGSIDEAEALLNKFADKATKDLDKARMLIARAYVEWHRSRFEAGKKMAESGLRLLNMVKDTEPDIDTLKGDCYSIYGNILWDLGEPERADEAYRKALPFYETVHDEFGITKICNNLGLFYLDRGEFDRALEYFENAAALIRAHPNIVGSGTVFSNIGFIHTIFGNFKEAEANFKEAIQICKSGSFMTAVYIAQRNLSDMFVLKGELKKARKWAELSINGYQDINDEPKMARAMCSLASVHQAEGNLKEARKIAETAVLISAKHNSVKLSAYAYHTFGSILRDAGLNDMAKSALEKSLQDYMRTKDYYGLMRTKIDLALVLKAMGDLKSAKAMASEPRKFFTRWNSMNILKPLDNNGL